MLTIETHVWLARVGICVDIAARAQLTTARAAPHDDQVLRVGNVDFTTDTLIALLSLLPRRPTPTPSAWRRCSGCTPPVTQWTPRT